MKYVTLNTHRTYLDKIKERKESIELRSGASHFKIAPGDVLRFRETDKDKPECSCQVTRVEQFLHYGQFKALYGDDASTIILSGFKTGPELDKTLHEFYPTLESEPFIILHLGEVELTSCPGEGVNGR